MTRLTGLLLILVTVLFCKFSAVNCCGFMKALNSEPEEVEVIYEQTNSNRKRMALPTTWEMIYMKPVFMFDTKQYPELYGLVHQALRFFRRILKVRPIKFFRIRKKPIDPFCPGPGQWNDTDFVFNIHLQDTHCTNDTVAWAGLCGLDPLTGRPVAARLTICYETYEFNKQNSSLDWRLYRATVIHELTHTLAFNMHLFKYFTDHRTGYKYHPQQLKATVSQSDPPVVPGVVKRVTREWSTRKAKVQHDVYLIVTPEVIRAAQKHFECPTLEGAELENQGGDGSAWGHWEKRLFEQEIMSSTMTESFTMSNITLALFYDSGFYKVNFSYAEEMQWGRAAGCTFAKQSCLDYETEMSKSGKSFYPFCKKPDKFRCSPDRMKRQTCKWGKSTVVAAGCYDLFPPVNSIYPDENAADCCPHYRTVKAIAKGSTDGDCSQWRSRKLLSELEKATMQTFSEESRCFEIDNRDAIIDIRNGSFYNLTNVRFETGCFKHKCENGTLFVKTSRSQYYPCYKTGQVISIKRDLTGIGIVRFKIICPACTELCSRCKSHVCPDSIIGDPDVKRDRQSIFDSSRRNTFSLIVILLFCVME